MTPTPLLALTCAAALGAAPLAALQDAPRGTLVVAVSRVATTPVPSLWQNTQANREVSDLLFLHLADPDRAYQLTDERAWQPRLARRWTRRDSLTLAFELDPRARWHDGRPVVADDVVLGLERGRNPRLAAQTATALTRVGSVTAESERVVVVRFTAAYSEQFYDAVFHAPPLPSHLLRGQVPESLLTSAFTRHPVGNGPYRLARPATAERLELEANDRFFLGRPGIGRILFLAAPDGETRVNLLLAGEVDAVENLYALPNWPRVERLPDYQNHPLPGTALIYAGFNQRDPDNLDRPHPLFASADLRRALVQAVPRERLGRGAYGSFTQSPAVPLATLPGRGVESPPPIPWDTAAARRALRAAGWVDRDGDGVLDKDGRPLRFRLMIPAPVTTRVRMGTEMQEIWRQLGVAVELEMVEIPVFQERRAAGRFDMDIYGANQDPTPSGLSQSWSCGGMTGSNALHYCNPRVDSLLARALVDQRRAAALYRDALRLLASDAPAIVLAAPMSGVPVHRRFTGVRIRAESAWADAWQWRLAPGQALPRDRQ